MPQLKYPYDQQEDYKATIRFSVAQDPPTIFNGGSRLDAANRGEIFANIFRSTAPAELRSTGDYAELYLPPSFQISDGVQIENVDIGFVGAALGSAVNAASGIESVQQIAEVIGTEVGKVQDLVQVIRGQGEAGARAAAAQVATRLPSNLQGTVASVTRTTANPNTRALFRSVNIREFTFSFKMQPTSRAEAEEIDQIISFFRKELYPATIDALDAAQIAYEFPNLFNIEIRYNGRRMPNVPRFLPCYLRNINTNFNPTSMAFHRGGKFSEIDLSLTFIENRPLRKQEIEAGF